MRKQSDLGDYEINAENEPVVGVSKVIVDTEDLKEIAASRER